MEKRYDNTSKGQKNDETNNYVKGKVVKEDTDSKKRRYVEIEYKDERYRCYKELKVGQIVEFIPQKNDNGKLSAWIRSQKIASEQETEDRDVPLWLVSQKQEFDNLYEAGNYSEALSSGLVKTISSKASDFVPFDYIVDVIVAARKILGIDEELKLSEFDIKFITEKTLDGIFAVREDILNDGASEYFMGVIDNDAFREHFNNLSKNCSRRVAFLTYLHIAERFKTVYNPLCLPFYVLATYADNKDKIIKSYYDFIKDSSVFEKDIIKNSFVAFNKMFYNCCLAETSTETGESDISAQKRNREKQFVNRCLGFALDVNMLSIYEEVCDDKYLSELLSDESVPYDKLVKLLDDTGLINLKAAQKYINYYMYNKFSDNGSVNSINEMIELLSRIAYAYPISYLDEILSNDSYTDFSRVNKYDFLKNNFLKILEKMNGNCPKAYILAWFAVRAFKGDVTYLDNDGSFEVFRQKCVAYLDSKEKLKERLYEIYPYFKLDEEGRGQIENKFRECLEKDDSYKSDDNNENTIKSIKEFNQNNCAFVSLYYFEKIGDEKILKNDNLAPLYVESLNKCLKYKEAIEFLKNRGSYDKDDKDKKQLIETLYSNFKEFGVSNIAYNIFNNTSITMDKAEEILINEAYSPKVYLVLMAIYNKKGDSARLYYVYSMYSGSTDVGNRYFYKQLHESNPQLSKMKNPYNTLRFVFTHHKCEDIISFVDWASKIKVTEAHGGGYDTFGNVFNLLVQEPSLKQNWEKVIEKLEKYNSLNSAFGYAFQCIYIIKFYDNILGKEDAELFVKQVSNFPSFVNVNETTNFISLNLKMIDIMPETYVIKFADFFEKNSILFTQNKNINNKDIEALYVRLLDKYNETFNDVYFDTALNVISVFPSVCNPHFDKYTKFCGSLSDKTKLFKLLFKLYLVKKDSLVKVVELLGGNVNCTDDEAQVLNVLKQVYSTDGKLNDSIKKDISFLMQDYPLLSNYNAFILQDTSLAYKYDVLKYIMQASFNQEIYFDTNRRYWDVLGVDGHWESLVKDNGISSLMGFLKVCLEKQSKYVQSPGVEFTSRRYITLYLIEAYEALCGSSNSINERYILDLMKENLHTDLISEKYYKPLKDTVSKLWNADIAVETKKAILLSVIRGTIIHIVNDNDAFSELTGKKELHGIIKSMFDLTVYPSVSQSAFYWYFKDENTDILELFELFELFEGVVPSVAAAIEEYNKLGGSDKEKMTAFIKYAYEEQNHKKFLLTVIKENYELFKVSDYEKCQPIILNVIKSVVYDYNMIRDFGNAVRQGFKFSENIFEGLLKDNHPEVYKYLCAIRYALNGMKGKVRAIFGRGSVENVNKKELPEIWYPEYDRLKKYSDDDSINKFETIEIYNDFIPQQEDIVKIQKLIKTAVEFSDNNSMKALDNKEKLEASQSLMADFMNTENSEITRFKAGSNVLAFVKENRSLFAKSLRENIKDKISYNEFVFEYGLLVLNQINVSSDDKLEVLLELFDLGERTNGSKKRDVLIRSFSALFNVKRSDDFISYDLLVGKYEDIKNIFDKIKDNKVVLDGADVFLNELERYTVFEKESPAVMEKIGFLEKLFSSTEELESLRHNLRKSVTSKLEQLKNGVMATVSVSNIKDDNTGFRELEANSVFIIIENLKNSKVAINLDSGKRETKLNVKVAFPKNVSRQEENHGFYCSGKIKSIRPGQMSPEKIDLTEIIGTELEDGEVINISITLNVNGVDICNNKGNTSFVLKKADANRMIKNMHKKYKTTSAAFTDENPGFGRTTEKEWLKENLTGNNISVIYGPSRVGKSSLLKYIETKFSVDSESADSKTYIIPCDVQDDKLCDSDSENFKTVFLEPLYEKLKEIYGSSIDYENINVQNLDSKLNDVKRILSGCKAKIWILIDEFQNVFKRQNMDNNESFKWDISKSALFKKFCELLMTNKYGIKYVLCGADELVKYMIYPKGYNPFAENSLPIDQFKEKDKCDYFKMLKDIWNGNCPFTDEALDYIFSYTGGNALYGKMIGNKIIACIQNRDFINRQCIYPYDVSSVIATMANDRGNNLTAAGDAGKFISNVTKNLEKETKYLCYIAELMMKEPARTRVSFTEIRERFPDDSEQDIFTALHICSVRGIIRTDEEKGDGFYSFTTTFYFSQFCEVAKGQKTQTAADDGIKNEKRSLDELVSELKSLNISEFETLKKKIPFMFKENGARVINMNGGNYLEEGDDRSEHYHVNIQNMTNTFNQILAGVKGDDLLPLIKKLPKLTQYCDPNVVASLESESAEKRIEAEAEISKSTEQMVSDYQKALASQQDDDFCVWDVLGINKEAYDFLSQKIAPNIMTDLFFAAKLDSIFDIIAKDNGINANEKDFSPVCIMYCKIVEKMLKKYHTMIYQQRLPGASTQQKYNNVLVKFEELSNDNIRKAVQNKITMGAFLYPINPNYNKDVSYNSLAGGLGYKYNMWHKHGTMLEKVTSIRNNSAHGTVGKTVDISMFSELKECLFEKGGLVNIVSLID